MSEKKPNYRQGLNSIQTEMLDELVAHNVGEHMGSLLVKKHSFVDIEEAITKHRAKGMSVVEYLTFKIQLSELTTAERKLYYEIFDKFGTEPGDEHLAMLMVVNYDTKYLQDIAGNYKKGSMTIDVFAVENVYRKCRFKIVTVEADPELAEDPGYTETCPF